LQIDLTEKNLTEIEKSEIEKLLQRENKNITNDLEQIWFLMDLVWDDCECDDNNLNEGNISKFYSHPVWLLNGLFIEQHQESMGHRHAISDWVVQKNFKNVVDYGGGFGTLARLIADKDKTINVNIYEPHPSRFGLKRASEFENIKIINELNSDYDCLLSTDVLEHVPDPLNDFAGMIKSVRSGGYLVIANAFYPMIKSHLTKNFHFRYTFNIFAKMMRLERIGVLERSYATIFIKNNNMEPNWIMIRTCENISKIVFLFIEIAKLLLRPIKKIIIK